jgi:hypothetical protein
VIGGNCWVLLAQEDPAGLQKPIMTLSRSFQVFGCFQFLCRNKCGDRYRRAKKQKVPTRTLRRVPFQYVNTKINKIRDENTREREYSTL